ncbi:uncharacterized protein VICG_00068 [Vittaforma corneae ATCC 50505]|uniref:Uncharacterized protein n=1 Tax=Vittaforma corneae (strain ATCC 50505) TaxID=993615 RepID=L2GPD7_VITCO|nr:uncharacterized protein VICG_00068 [Vittaforma corneae ATCC 50505]ELA42753.1 hypothetical protein VICG_00068 [Vittaforma corneae ATCC 50505]
MQRLSSVVRNKENTSNVEENTSTRSTPNKAPDIRLEINQDVLFLISRLVQGFTSKRRNHETSSNSQDLQIATPYLFSYDFGLNKNIRTATVKGSCLVKLKCFEGLKINKLKFEKISAFEVDRLENFNVTHLVLKDTNINIGILNKLICTLSPLSLDLINVQLVDKKHSRYEIELYSMIFKSKICCLGIENSFMPIDYFFKIVHKKSMKKFYYKNLNSMVKYCALGRSFSYFMVREIDLSGVFDPSWLSVEILSTDYNSVVLDNIQQIGSRIKFQWLENCTISTSMVKKFPRLSSIYFSKCIFEGISFYELINSQKHTLKYISLDNTDLPFDGVQYISQCIKECKVVFNSIAIKEYTAL